MKQRTLFASDACPPADQVAKPNVSSAAAKTTAKKKKQVFDASHAKPTWLSNSKLSASNPNEEVGESSNDNDNNNDSSYLQCTQDQELVQYLTTLDANLSGSRWIAKQYLVAGPPFKGCHIKGFNGQIRAAGGRYMKNQMFKKGEYDPDVPFGWYVACSPRNLKSLLNMLRNVSGEKVWKPVNVSDDDSDLVIRHILELMEEFEEHKQTKLNRERQANLEKKQEQEATAKSASARYVWDDKPCDIETLERQLGGPGTYDADMIRSSATFDRLGPPMSTNLGRVLRAMHLNILTPKDVKLGNFDGTDHRWARQRKRRTPDAEEAASDDETDALKRGKKQQATTTTTTTTTASEPAISYLMTDEQLAAYESIEREERDQADMDANGAKVCPKEVIALLTNTEMKATQCLDCDSNIDDQFLDCTCDGLAWKKCRTCFSAYTLDVDASMPSNSAKRRMPCRCPCTCSLPDVEYPVEHAAEEEMQADGENASTKANDETTQQNTKTRAEFENVPIHDDDL